jgi:hypothetical protein
MSRLAYALEFSVCARPVHRSTPGCTYQRIPESIHIQQENENDSTTGIFELTRKSIEHDRHGRGQPKR